MAGAPPNKKQKLVNADDTDMEVDNNQQVRTEMNKAKRDSIFRMLLAMHLRVSRLLYATDTPFDNISFSMQVTSIVITVHNNLRQDAIDSGTLKATLADIKHQAYVGSSKSLIVEHKVLKEVFKKIAVAHGHPYDKPDPSDKEHWYGTAAPLLCFMNLFKVRLTELRIGHSKMTAKKAGGIQSVVPMLQYGLCGAHQILLEGITVAPERKAGMAQSLGPMTCWISLCRSSVDSKYAKKWKNAVKRDCPFLPDSLMDAVCGKQTGEVNQILPLIGDILLMTTSREAKRASFPACMLYSTLSNEESGVYTMSEEAHTTVEDLSWFDYSGKGAFFQYKQCEARKWKMSIDAESSSILPEVVYHSIFGTYSEDFGILSFMTNKEAMVNSRNEHRSGKCNDSNIASPSSNTLKKRLRSTSDSEVDTGATKKLLMIEEASFLGLS